MSGAPLRRLRQDLELATQWVHETLTEYTTDRRSRGHENAAAQRHRVEWACALECVGAVRELLRARGLPADLVALERNARRLRALLVHFDLPTTETRDDRSTKS